MPPPHLSDLARVGYDRASKEGNCAMAKEFCSARSLLSTEAEVYAQFGGDLLKQRGDVEVVGNTNNSTAAAALNEVDLVPRTYGRVLLKFKAMRTAFRTR